MDFKPTTPPRAFEVGLPGKKFPIYDCGKVALRTDEQVTLVTEAGAELDVVRKSWGYYGTPSLNGRLPRFGLRAVLGKSADGKYFLLLVEKGKEAEFESYMSDNLQTVVCWMDSTEALESLEKKVTGR